MKQNVLILVTIFFAAISLSAQKNDINLNEVKQLASESNKRIMLVFKGSDWCAPCIKLEKEILMTDKFQNLSQDTFITLIADFPRKKKNQLSKDKQELNNDLAEKYNPNGYFPFVVILSPQGKTLGSVGYEKTTPQSYFEKINTFK